MSLDQLFSISGAAAAVGWLLLLAVPLRFAFPRPAAVSIALGIAMLYAALIGVHFSAAGGGFGSLDQVAQLFEQRGMLLAGWVHYLAFDLLIGVWERDEARRIGLPQWLLAPCLLLTFMLGPLGWLVFLGVRRFRMVSNAYANTGGLR